MPHLTIEYSANVSTEDGGPVDISGLVAALHAAALGTGVASLDALRTRAVGRRHYSIADGDPDNMFIAVTARLGAGRSVDDKHHLIETLMTGLDAYVGESRRTMMLSVEYQDIDPEFRINKNHLRSLIAARTSTEETS